MRIEGREVCVFRAAIGKLELNLIARLRKTGVTRRAAKKAAEKRLKSGRDNPPAKYKAHESADASRRSALLRAAPILTTCVIRLLSGRPPQRNAVTAS